MTRRLKREHGRIMSVETKVRGDALAEDAAAGATALILGDAADFDEDGGWLTINGQVVEFTEVDDDEGTITLATGLDAAAEEGDHVHVWSTLYDEVVDYQEALVELDGEYDNPEPVVAEVAEGVGDLPEGDRGVDGESCTLIRVSDDEWEIVGVGGRARKSKGIRFEADDAYTLTASDIAGGSASFTLSHRPIDESLILTLGIPQQPTEYAIDQRTVTCPLAGWEQAGDVIWVHYAYRKGLASTVILPFQSPGWSYLQVDRSNTSDYSGTGFDDSGWAVGPAAFGGGGASDLGPSASTTWDPLTAIWLRRTVTNAPAGRTITATIRYDDHAEVYWNGALIGELGSKSGAYGEERLTIAGALVGESNVLAIRAADRDGPDDPGNVTYVDVELVG